jgi:hypothetical protein
MLNFSGNRALMPVMYSTGSAMVRIEASTVMRRLSHGLRMVEFPGKIGAYPARM